PEGLPLTELLGAASTKGDIRFAEMETVFRTLDSRSREVKLQCLRVTMDEIEDAVPAGIHPCNQVGPCDRTLGGNTRCKLAERPLCGQLREVRRLALAHELAQELRVHAIDTENDEPVPTAPLAAGAIASEQDNKAEDQQSGDEPGKSFQSRLASPDPHVRGI